MEAPGDDDEGLERGFTFALGAVGVLALTERLNIQGEALYVRKGAALDYGSGEEGAVRMDYVEVPVLARYALGAGTGATPYFYGGVAPSFYLSGEVELDGQTETLEDIASMDVALQIGGGLDVPMSAVTITVDARYSHGLIDGLDDADAEAYHRVFTIFGGVLF